MNILTLDFETLDKYLGKSTKAKPMGGLGAGWIYKNEDNFKVLGVSLKEDDGEPYYLDLTIPKNVDKLRTKVKQCKILIAHNASYELGILWRLGINWEDKVVLDTETIARLYNSEEDEYNLGYLAKKYLTNTRKVKDTLGKAAFDKGLCRWKTYDEKKCSKWALQNMDVMQKECYDVVEYYANMDVQATYELFKHYMNSAKLERWDVSKFKELCIEKSMLCKASVWMRTRGVRVDLKRLREIKEEFTPILAGLAQKIFDIAGEEFEIGGKLDKIRIFDKLGIKYPVTPKGNPSFTGDWLAEQDHPLCQAIAEYNECKKNFKDFVLKIEEIQQFTLDISPEEVQELDYGIVYPEINVMRARTGRFSCRGPNLQQIPSSKVWGPLCRSIYVPHEGETMYSLDWCYSEDTEVLTENGFKLWKDVSYTDNLAQYHTDYFEEGKISYSKPKDLIKMKYSGKMHRFSGKHLDLLVSPNHDLVQRSASGKTFKRKAIDGHKKGVKNIHSGTLSCPGILEDYRLQVAIDADGSIKKGLCTFYLKKERKINRLIVLLKMKEIKYTLKENLPSKPGYTAIYFRWEQKELTRRILNLSTSTKKLILDELQYWDGAKGQFFTAKKEKADLIQELAVTTGYRASISKSKGGYTGSDIYIVYFQPKDYTWSCNNSYEEVDYYGNIYCATMPKGTLIVRRNGKVTVSGNCNQEGRIIVDMSYRHNCEGSGELVTMYNNEPMLDLHMAVANMMELGCGNNPNNDKDHCKQCAEARTPAKAIGLGLGYGMGIDKLARSLKVSEEEAKYLRELYKEKSPYLTNLSKHLMRQMKIKGYVETQMGRRVHRDKPIYINGEKKEFDYKAMNKAVQGEAADDTGRVMVECYKRKLPILLPIHDQFLLSTSNKQDAYDLKDLMENGSVRSIPYCVDMDEEGGQSWDQSGH